MPHLCKLALHAEGGFVCDATSSKRRGRPRGLSRPSSAGNGHLPAGMPHDRGGERCFWWEIGIFVASRFTPAPTEGASAIF